MRFYKEHLLVISTLFAISVLCSCGDGPMEAAEEDYQDTISKAEQQLSSMEHKHSSSSMRYSSSYDYRNDNYSSSSSSYNYWDDFYSSSSSIYIPPSSSSTRSPSLVRDMTIYFTLTYYEQISSNWDAFNGAGDPEVSFTIYLYNKNNTSLGSKSTGLLLNKQDTRKWSGLSSISLPVPASTYKIRVCPKVIDEDLSEHDDYTSGNCYDKSAIGMLDSYENVYQSDDSKDYSLEWEWYLY